jgi:glycosyltransferase involved in cell wall biosynthesis
VATDPKRGRERAAAVSEVDDVDSLAGVIHQALTDEGERQRRGANALSLIRKRYDWRVIAQRSVEVYESISR